MKRAMLRRREILGAVCTGIAPLALATRTQVFPNRPLRIFVGYAAGGAVDTMARLLSQALGTSLQQSVIVENRGGAAGMLAADVVAKSPGDGYTLLMGESGLLISPYMQIKPLLVPLNVLKPVAGLFESRMIIVVSPEFAASTPNEFIALLKEKQGNHSYGTSGVGTVHHLGFELLKARTGMQATHVAYRGGSQIIPDVISGQIPIAVISATAAAPHVRVGKLKAIATLSSRMPGLDHVPAFSELVPGFSVAPRQMLLAPPRTPDAPIQKLAETLREVLASPSLIEMAAQQSVIPRYLPPNELSPILARESEMWARLIKAQGIKSD